MAKPRGWDHFLLGARRRSSYDGTRCHHYTWHCQGVTCSFKPSNIVLTIVITGILLYFAFKPFIRYRYPENVLGPWRPENDTWLPDPDQICTIPRLDPFDKTIIPFLTGPTDIRCHQRFAWMTFVDEEGWLRLNDSAVKEAGYTGINDTSLNCEYAAIERVPGDDSVTKLGTIKPLTAQGDLLVTDFVRVRCKSFLNFAFYDNFHVNVRAIDKSEVSAINSKVLCSSGLKKQHRSSIGLPNEVPSDLQKSSPPPNVIVLGFDSMSRSNFIRQLPLSRHYLIDRLGAVELRGYNKVGDNTYPNLVPMLTGLHHRSPKLPPAEFTDDTRRDIPDENVDRRKRNTNSADATYPFHDSWPFIWKKYQQNGYVNLFSEDHPPLSLFNYAGQGFYKAPTHHYLRPFWLAAYASMLHGISNYLCLGSTPTHEITLDYLSRFARTYAKLAVPFFGFTFLTDISHDYPNQASAMDAFFLNWLTKLHQSGALNNTVFIVMSDHGYRYGNIRRTAVGRLEDRMPFCAIALPPQHIQKRPLDYENLVGNKFRLSTPYDIHATLLDILLIGQQCNESGATTLDGSDGLSLLKLLPKDRTCKSARIPSHYCICDQEKDIAVVDKRSELAAVALLAKLNSLTVLYRSKCAVLTLGSVVEAQVIQVNKGGQPLMVPKSEEGSVTGNKTVEIRVTIVTQPGEGIFEGLVHVSALDVEVSDDISRVNAFGHQADCLTKDLLRTNGDLSKYCYCTS